MKRRAFLILALIGAWFRPRLVQAQTPGTLTNIEIIPNPSGCNHVTLRCLVDGKQFERSFMRSDLQLNSSDDVADAILSRVRSHIKESGLVDLSQIRSSLRAQVFKI